MADIEQLIEKTRGQMKQYLSDLDHEYEEYDGGMLTWQEGSAVVGVTVRSWTDEDAVVEFTSQLVNDARIDAELMKWLLEKNSELHFGGFGLLFDGTIVYSYALPASSLTRETFHSAAMTVSTIADHYDDEIVEMAGGELIGRSAI